MKIQNPDEGVHHFRFGDGSTRYVAELETTFIGKGLYKPGWRWSKDVGPQSNKTSERHVGYVISGSFGVSNPDGYEEVVREDEAFELGPNHDAWVIGDDPCLALDFVQRSN